MPSPRPLTPLICTIRYTEWKINIPLQYLPEGVNVGDILTKNLQIDSPATEKQNRRNRDVKTLSIVFT